MTVANLMLPELVPCPPQRARMTQRACVKLWQSTRERPPAPHEARAACIGCALGPQRAGIDVAAAQAQARAAAFAEAMRRVCPRCERLTTRFIRGRTCVSCYNRTGEVIRGRNAKGTPPVRILARIRTESLALAAPVGEVRVVAVEHVTSRTEAAAIVARVAGPGAIIGVPPLALPETPGTVAA